MNLSYTTLSIQEKTIEEAVNVAKQWGLSGIELRGREHSHAGVGDSFSYLLHVKRLIEESGLQIPCLTAYTRFYQPDLSGVLHQAEELSEMLCLAEFLGAKTVRTFMGPVPEGMTVDQAMDQARAGFDAVTKKMENSPVKVAIETHDSVKDGRTLARLLKGVSKKIGVLLDIIHPWDMGESIEETWELVGDRIYHVHIKDIVETVPGGRIYSPIGTGRIPVEHIMRFLMEKGYEGFFSLEWEKSAPGYLGVSFEKQVESFMAIGKQIGGGL